MEMSITEKSMDIVILFGGEGYTERDIAAVYNNRHPNRQSSQQRMTQLVDCLTN